MNQCTLGFQERALRQQGYGAYSADELRQLRWGLRFTPFACALLTLAGLVAGSPWVLFAVAFLGVWAFFFPAGHPMDWLYNHVVRHLHGGVPLPPNPLQRRLACLSAAVLNATAGLLFLVEAPLAARIVGGVLLALQALVITTHFCMLSWMYEGVLRLLGRWQEAALDAGEIAQWLRRGAVVVDVRSAHEYARDHIEGAVNWPSEWIKAGSEVPLACAGKPMLLHCQSGMRSQQALGLLQGRGFEVLNLGSLADARHLLQEARQVGAGQEANLEHTQPHPAG